MFLYFLGDNDNSDLSNDPTLNDPDNVLAAIDSDVPREVWLVENSNSDVTNDDFQDIDNGGNFTDIGGTDGVETLTAITDLTFDFDINDVA